MNHDSAESIADTARTLKDDGARRAYLDRACSGSEHLRTSVENILKACDRQAETFFCDDGDDLPTERAGETIGRYKLLEEIGHGGFGTVWIADQQEPVKRRVALKIIKLGMDTRQVVARFEQERQALALMDHPNVARVLDAGSTATGRPYFVMDLVHGEPIDRYSDAEKLTIEARLHLFGQVCNAVEHAHSKGIIHRDLKPSNVLVSTVDGKPHATVIDFGIAKATSTKLTDRTLVTEAEQVIGTIQYMSPEQAEGSLDIDTRTDVYSLGVLLYELLTGSTPFDQGSVGRALFGELRRLIREVEPPTPSARITESRDTLPAIAELRRVEPGKLKAQVRGEIDWIVMKALEKDRARRYATVHGLATEIRRYLAGETVLAAPPSATYRLSKFVRRNKRTVAAAGAVGLALMVGLVGFAWQANVAATERDAARLAQAGEEKARLHAEANERLARQAQTAEAKERVRAEANERKAAAINQFLLDMLGSANIRKIGRDAKVSQALDNAAAAVGRSFADRPDVEASLQAILGETYTSLGMLDQAEPHMARALELALSQFGADSEQYARRLRDRGHIEQGRGKPEAALATYAEALRIVKRAFGAKNPLAVLLECERANVLVKLKEYEEAEDILRDAIETYEEITEEDDRNTHLLVNSLAVMLHDQNRLDDAEPLYRRALAIGERVLGDEDPDTLTSRMNLGSMLRSRGKLVEAEKLLAASYAGIAKVFGENHPKTAAAASVLGGLYYNVGRIKDALPLYERSLAIRRVAEGERTAAVAEIKGLLGLALQRLGERERSVTLEREALDTWVELEGADGKRALSACLDLANTLVATGRGREAEPLFKDLLERCPRVLGEDSEANVIANNSFAVLLLGELRYAEAEPFIRKALLIGRRVQGPEHRNTLITQCNLCTALRELGRLDEASSLGQETLEAFDRVFGPKHINTATARTALGETLAKLGKNDEAEAEYVRAIAIAKEAMGEKNAAFTGAAMLLGKLMIDSGRAAEAEPILREVVEVRTQARGAADARTAVAKARLGSCLTALRRYSDAESLLVESHAALVAVHPVGHPDIRQAARGLADLYIAWNAAEADPGRAERAVLWKGKAAESTPPTSQPIKGP